MPTWGELLKEFEATRQPNGTRDNDLIRRKYLMALSDYTKRPVIAYYTAFLEGRPVGSPMDLQINLGDIQAIMECLSGIPHGGPLDLIIHSPGGLAEATESIVSYLRNKFTHIRAIVPIAAMSAATMLALSCDEILMGYHSQLGPIDPQFILNTPEGIRSSPGQAILDQFELAKEECKNIKNLAAWTPILRSYAPGLLAQCKDQQELAERMVAEWLEQYMFHGRKDAMAQAQTVAKWFANYKEFKSHGRPVRIEQLKELELNVKILEEDQGLQDAVLSVHHCFMHTLTGGPHVVKIVENNVGKAYVKITQLIVQKGQQKPTPVVNRQQFKKTPRSKRKS